MILHIDTKDQKKVRVEIREKKEVISKLTAENEYGSQALLPLIEKVLQGAGCKLQDLKEIKVETGPGSFTGIRVGVAVANALGYALNIPVNGKKIETDLLY